MNFSEQDLNMLCLLGKCINLMNIGSLKPKSIDTILDMGFNTYNQYLSIVCVTSDDIYDLLDMNDDFRDVDPFDFILNNCLNNEEFKMQVEKALSFFFEENVYFFKHIQDDICIGGYFYINDINEGRFIHMANFNFIASILKQQNCVSGGTFSKLVKPRNEAEKNMYRQLKKARAKYKKQDTDISDIVSSVSAKHPSINLFNIGSLTIYQLIDQYKRLNAIDEYFISIDSLLHGASSDDVKVVHWSSKQKND